ncbi:MAG: VWA domain-containing protein [Anaeroplasma sp.]
MNNISFANPYLLLILIPVFFILIIPFIITFRKGMNLGIRNIFSLVLHLIISIFVILLLAGVTYEKVITNTEVYVVCDVSFSSNRNLDKIDDYIEDLQVGLPKNSKVGVVCFGKGDPYVLATPGQKINSVKNVVNKIDQSGTDIASALRYTSSLFNNNVIKRIVLITDGGENNNGSVSSVVSELTQQRVYVDAIFLDNNIKDDTFEIQINDVIYSSSSYLNKTEIAQVSIQSNTDIKVPVIKVYKDNSLYDEIVPLGGFVKGINTLSFNLDSKTEGVFNYRIEIDNIDETPENNSYCFTQKVSKDMKILYLSNVNSEKSTAIRLYQKENCSVDFININQDQIPFSVEELIEYDEYVLSNIDIRSINNSKQFLINLETAISKYGKNLTTLGNTYIHTDKENEELKALSALLPVKYGDSAVDGRIITLVLDVSRSMYQSSYFDYLKETASKIVDLASENDHIMVVEFYGETSIVQDPVFATAGNKLNIKNKIENLTVKQGSLIGSALKNTHDIMKQFSYPDKQIYLISDAKAFAGDENNFDDEVLSLWNESRISTSTIYIGRNTSYANKMQSLALSAGGQFSQISTQSDIENVVVNQITENLTESVINGGNYSIDIVKKKDDSIYNFEESKYMDNINAIHGFYFAKAKASAEVVLQTEYDTTALTFNVPIYSYWQYGNGRVSSFSCDLATASAYGALWLEDWTEGSNADIFLTNLCISNIPDEKVDHPFVITNSIDGSICNLNISTPSINTEANLTLKIKKPDGKEVILPVTFNSQSYDSSFIYDSLGQYRLELTYTIGSKTYVANQIIDISTLPEYNSFERFDISDLNSMVNFNASPYQNGSDVVLENDNSITTTFSYDFTSLFMIISVILFVVDIIIRKVKWADIVNLFRKIKPQAKEGL